MQQTLSLTHAPRAPSPPESPSAECHTEERAILEKGKRHASGTSLSRMPYWRKGHTGEREKARIRCKHLYKLAFRTWQLTLLKPLFSYIKGHGP